MEPGVVAGEKEVAASNQPQLLAEPLAVAVPNSRVMLQSPARQQPDAPPNPWRLLLEAGLKLVEALAANPSGKGLGSKAAAGSWKVTDAQTGRSYLKIPVPDLQVVQQLQQALSRLLADIEKQ